MTEGACHDDPPVRDAPDGSDPDDFARRVRAFGLEAHRTLGYADSSFDELMALHWRAWSLLNEAAGERTPEVDRWVLVTRRATEARLNGRGAAEFEAGRPDGGHLPLPRDNPAPQDGRDPLRASVVGPASPP